MFSFFRRYQRAIYFVITAVIIISFSFFGTYTAFTSNKGDDPVVFKTVDGTRVVRSECNEYVHFLSMDSMAGDGASSSYNPLNDGVIANDIIATGIGELLVQRFAADFQADWQAKLRREKTFQPYHHPQAPFVSATQVWSYFAPGVKEALESYQSVTSDDPVEIYKKKAALYLAERSFPPTYLRQILSYQQQQFSWLEPDASLENRPLGMFGYQQLSDWFGNLFLEKACQFIMQVASVASQEGYSVSSDEALASLYHNAQEALKKVPHAEGLTADDLVRRTLQECSMDLSRATKLWADVLLFRRALIELPLKIVVNREPLASYLAHQYESVDLDCYQLQPCLRLTSMNDLYTRELWFQAVGEKSDQPASLALPQKLKTAAEVQASWPELVDRHVLISMASVSCDELTKRIRLRDIWNWQVDDANWESLVKVIPQLASSGSTREARLTAIDGLPAQLKSKADTLAKEAIIAAHPQWCEEALSAAKPETLAVGLRLRGGVFPFEGISDRASFIAMLFAAPIGELSPALASYTQDKHHFYRIIVQDRRASENIVPLPDLLADGTLNSLLDKVLEAQYIVLRSDHPSEFKNAKGEWKPLSEVRDRVAEMHFAPLLKQLDLAIAEYRKKYPHYCQWDDLKSARVAVRFLPHVIRYSSALSNGDPLLVTPVYPETDPHGGQASMEDRPLSELFLFVMAKEHEARFQLKEKPQFSDAFEVGVGSWMAPRYSRELGPFVAVVTGKGIDDYSKPLSEGVFATQRSLGREAICDRAEQLIKEWFP